MKPGEPNRRVSDPKQWRCSTCELPLAKEAVLTGDAMIVNGTLTCTTCVTKLKQQRRKTEFRLSPRVLLISGMVAIVSGVLLPELLVVEVLVASLGALAVGLWGPAARHKAQRTMIACALSGILLSLGAYQFWIGHRTQVRATSEVHQEVAAIQELLRAGNYVEAQCQNLKMQSRLAAAVRSGDNIATTESAVAASREAINSWLEQKYGRLSADDLRAADALLRQLAPGKDNKLRVISLSTTNDTLQLKIAAASSEPDAATINTDIQQAVCSVFTSVLNIQNIELILVDHTNSKTLATASAGRSRAMTITMSESGN